MIRRAAIIAIAFALLVVLGCVQANLHTVHEAPLLDNKVLQQRVEDALHRAGPDYSNVHVKARSGTILLTGTVPSAGVRVQAERISRRVYGVKNMDNELKANPNKQ